MAISDPIADMLTRIRNAGKAKFNSVDIPGSKLKIELAKDHASAIYGAERESRPGRRRYIKSKDLKPVYSGMGVAVLSTSRGVMTDKKAVKEKLGGEVLCKIW
jgi:small subunit ribosomal protein S8